MADTPIVSFRIPEWMLAQVRRIAELERRTVGAVIRLLLERQLGGKK